MPNTNLIAELNVKKNIEDSDIIIVEDNEDTKQSTVENLKKNWINRYYRKKNFETWGANLSLQVLKSRIMVLEVQYKISYNWI